MHLARLKLRDFRNYRRLEVDFPPGFHLLLGDNAQGKTNILEAIYLMSTLRSFRGVGGAQMIRHGETGYFVSGIVTSQGTSEIKMYWSAKERRLTLNNQPVKRLSEYLGVLRTVVFCSEDLQLVKGPSQRRRRFLDLLLAQTQPVYLGILRKYMEAVRARNTLLKQHGADPGSIDSFTQLVVEAGNRMMDFRRALLPRFLPFMQEAYARISGGREEVQLSYRPSVKQDFRTELAQARRREATMRTTLLGPHRDELDILLNGQSALRYGSEGQKRSVAIALKMAQAELLTDAHGYPPILLIDDVMGELDLRRRSGLVPLLERAHKANSQVFMTCTEENWPSELGAKLQRWNVNAGSLTPA